MVVAVRGLPGSPLPQVLHDDRAGGALAARHLIELGHRHIAQLRGPVDIGNFVARHEGFRDACHEAGVELLDDHGFGSVPSRAEGERLAGCSPARPPADSGGAHNDLMALGAAGAPWHWHLCPDDVSLVGYNDSPTIDQIDRPHLGGLPRCRGRRTAGGWRCS